MAHEVICHPDKEKEADAPGADLLRCCSQEEQLEAGEREERGLSPAKPVDAVRLRAW